MRIDFPFPGYEAIGPVEVPDANLMGVFSPRPIEGVEEAAVFRDGFANPYGAPRLRDAAPSGASVLILIDDGSRGTPVDRILPHVLGELHEGGVPDRRIELLVAQGTHREMTPQEIKKKLGKYDGKFRLHQHRWQRHSELRHYGQTRDGTPVTANRLLAEFDFVMGIGSIVPHRVKGTSGGAKIAFPGVSGPEMMYRNQWEASMQMSETVMGVAENSMRLRMEEAAQIAGLRYIVNIVSDARSKIVGCFTGDPVAAHRAGSVRCNEVFSAAMPDRADVVIVDSYPADRDFWQSAKGYYAGTMAVKRGGVMILVAPNPEGVASNHPNMLEIGYRPHAQIVEMVQHRKIDDLVGGAILADVAQIVDHAECFMVSPGVKPHEAQRLGLHWAASVQEALAAAMGRMGREASVAVLRRGGHILPVVATENLRGSPGGPTGAVNPQPGRQARQER